MKSKTLFICQNCGAIHRKWNGRCSECGEWNSITEEAEDGGAIVPDVDLINTLEDSSSIAFETLDGKVEDMPRFDTGIGELNRVLGGGIVQDSVILIGGDPGIGKSTLLLQTMCGLASGGLGALYISGEESTNQIRMRARRLGLDKTGLKIASATRVNDMVSSLLKEQPQVVVIDSIQTIFDHTMVSAAGTVSQVRGCGAKLINVAKTKNIVLFIVSHVNKDGQIAGPKVLEHMVDTVLYFEGDREHQFRILRSIKNRFGAANEIGIFEMHDSGLQEVTNPSQLFLSTEANHSSGSVVFVGLEGTRPLPAEIQVLLAPSYMSSPRRAVVGWDQNRLAMLVAVLSSRLGINLYDREIYLNIIGGLKLSEPAVDLAVITALLSAYRNITISKDWVFMGEVGLSGEIRMVSGMEDRLKEAEKLGFRRAFVPAAIFKIKTFKKERYKLEIVPLRYVADLQKVLGGGE